MDGIVKGNFTGQTGGVFPVDVETFQQLQDYIDAVAGIVALVDGMPGKQDGVILSGCELSSDGTRRGSGWLVLSGAHRPHLVYYTGGYVAAGITEVEEPVEVNAGGVSYDAYRRYVAKPGEGLDPANNYRWEDISERVTLGDVYGGVRRMDDVMCVGSVVGDVSTPVGKRELPDGWLWCDGSQYRVADYPELYAVIGDTYTPDGYEQTGVFNVPTLYVGNGNVGVGMYKIRAK